MSWIRATYSRRDLVFSLVESSNADDDDIDVSTMFDDSVPVATGSTSRQKTTRQRNASLKVRCSKLNLLLCSSSSSSSSSSSRQQQQL